MKLRSTMRRFSRVPGKSAFLFTGASRRMPESSNLSASNIRKSYFMDTCESSLAISSESKRKVQMSDRFCALSRGFASFLAVGIAVACLFVATSGAQAPKPAAKTPATASAKKTPDGQPDLQGYWSSQTTTPLERPANCGTKEFWTDEEMAKGVRTCGAAEGGQRGRGGAPGAGGGQRGRGQRSNGEVDPH